MSNKAFAFFLGVFIPIIGLSQHCTYRMGGYVVDEGTQEPLAFVSVLLSETQEGAITNHEGYFEFANLCKGSYHLNISHIGCETEYFFLTLNQDTILNLSMEHSHTVLEDVIIEGDRSQATSQEVESIHEHEIADRAYENLANMLEGMAGVSTLKNGNAIAKPVVHGLYGNRLTILNNGVTQSGQQWGNDHSPEIDPLSANQLSVIKGSAALAYQGSNLGAVVLVEPGRINEEPHVHGRAQYFFESNGRGQGIHIQMQQYAPSLAWKVGGSLKKSGDKHTPDYFLNNTGSQEANLSLQLEKTFSDRWSADMYISTFNTELGVLRGSHISNLTDLSGALGREVPFFTEDTFSYHIEAPKQRVHHHLGKIHSNFIIDHTQALDVTLAAQINFRKEFDVRRSGRTEIPALSLEQFSYFAEAKYQKSFRPNLSLKTGLQFNLIDNANNPETGILPLIPDYFSYETGAFAILNGRTEKMLFEAGLRYDHVFQKVAAFSNTRPLTVLRYDNSFHNLSASSGATYRLGEGVSLAANVGYATRNPGVNELYSGGLHQGVSGIEEGDPNLISEKALKATMSMKADLHGEASFEALLYAQHINDYIFLNPQDEIRLTIRGAFPVFKYEQTDARLYGLDISGRYEITHALNLRVRYSYLRGQDLTNDLPLINIPSNNLRSSCNYEYPNPIKIAGKQLENLKFELNNLWVFRQNNLLPSQDYVLPPDSYNLLGLSLSGNIQLGSNRLRVVGQVNNLLNEVYRDYLNRQRYFADEMGRNMTLTLSLKF